MAPFGAICMSNIRPNIITCKELHALCIIQVVFREVRAVEFLALQVTDGEVPTVAWSEISCWRGQHIWTGYVITCNKLIGQ